MSIEFKPAENSCIVTGILSEVKLKEGTSKKSGQDYVIGDIVVKTTEQVQGAEIELEVPVRVFANKLTKKNTPNPAYESILNIKEMVSLAACGGDMEKADLISFETANLAMNEFYGRNDQLVSYPIVRGTFSKKVNKSDYTPKATFSNVIVIGAITEEVDRNGNLTGRLKIKGILPQWGNRVDIVEYVVASEGAINHIQTHWSKGDTVRVAGIINFSSRTETEIVEMGFGEPEEKHHTISIHELLITKGSEGPLDPEFAYDNDTIAAALAQRSASLAEMKKDADNRAKNVAASTTTDFNKEVDSSNPFGF